jgi:hypothetical protein
MSAQATFDRPHGEEDRAMSDERIDETEPPMPLRTKVIAGTVVVIALAGAGWGLLRAASPAIGLGQTPPPGHYSFDCGLCHTVTPIPPGEVAP